jgi:hypothetical protein
MHILGIVLAAVAGFILGGAWYSPPLFGHVWARESGTPETHNPDPKAQVRFFVILLVLLALVAAVLAYALAWRGAAGAVDGLEMGAVAAVLAVAVVGMDTLFERKRLRLFLINAGYYAASFCVMGAIVGAL